MKSVVSYPERGEGGKSSYRGNCSPKLIEDLYEQFQFDSISDYMCGSGTTEAVANKLGIENHCYDLNRGFDLMSMDIKERNEFTFWHPPYGSMIIYSDEQYSAKEVMDKYGFDPRQADLSRIPTWEDFVKAMNYCCIKQFAALEKGGRMAVLVGDWKRKGTLYSMISEIVKPGTLEQIVIKMQHNCVSDQRSYTGKFIPICHEYLMIVRKDGGLYIPVMTTKRQVLDMRDSHAATWKDVLYEVLQEFGAPAKLEAIYEMVDGHRKAAANPNWKAKVRQTLQMHPELFRHETRGVWCAAA